MLDFSNVGTVISLFAVVFGIIASIGGAFAYFGKSRGDNIIKYQATEISLRDGKIAELEKSVATLTETGNAKDQTIIEIKKHNSYLQKLAQGSPQLKRLTTAVENQTKLINTFLGVKQKENTK